MQNKYWLIIGILFWGFTIKSSANEWVLSTKDTYCRIAIRSERIYLDSLYNPIIQWNWTQSPSEVPLLNTVSIGDSTYTPDWIFQEATVDSSANSKIIMLRFKSANPTLELKSIWSAKSGPGPVENWITVQNLTGGKVTYTSATAAANIKITSNNKINLHRCDKTNVGNGKVYTDTIGVNASFTTNSKVIPLMIFDVQSKHGFYTGLEWEIGGFKVSSGANPLAITASVYPITENVSQENNAIFTIPNVYYGTYKGDIDDGSNSFKKWFWNYKIPRSLHDNSNEPWVQMCIGYKSGPPYPGVTGATPQSHYDSIAATGAECVKLDYWDGTNTCWYTNGDWMYHANVWPSGFDYATKAHKAGLKASLYMGGTYKNCDLNTIEGRDSELNALLTRYDQGWFDMWRTDQYIAPHEPMPATYNGNTNFLSIQDSLIKTRPGYRYENCDNGGTYKGFSICRRMTFCTMNDSPSNAGTTRTTFYSNSFAINPVQLKSDLLLSKTPYSMRTHMLGAISSPEADNPVYRQHISLYKSMQRPILRGCSVYHILPLPDGVNWDGLEFFNDSLNKGSVFLFKPMASAIDRNSKVIKLKGLNRSANYTLIFQDRRQLNCIMTGAELMDTGIKVTGMTGYAASEIIWINSTGILYTSPAKRLGSGTVSLGATASNGILNWYADSIGGSSLGTGSSFTTPVINSSTTYYIDATYEGFTSERTGVTATIDITNGFASNRINKKFTMFPNPANDQVTLSFEGYYESQNATVLLYDMQGNLLLQKECSNETEVLDLIGFAKGVYIVKVCNADDTMINKLVIR